MTNQQTNRTFLFYINYTLCVTLNNTEQVSTHFQLHCIAKIVICLLYSIFTETVLNHFQQFAEERDVRSKQAIIGSYKEEI